MAPLRPGTVTLVNAPDRTYEIHEVASLTGLAPARLRAWERRYEVVRPKRMPNGYRAYSADQVALLRAFARLIEAGQRIGDLVELPRERVLALAADTERSDSGLGALLDAVRALDRDRLEALVAQQLALRGLRGFAEAIVVPLAVAVGDLWALGRIPIAAEHLATEVVVHALKGGLRVSRGSGPLVVGCCLPGERHEWGVLATFAILQERGWRVQYLGPDLPVEDLVEAAWTLRPRVVALSASDAGLVDAAMPALAVLPARLPSDTRTVIGGAGAAGRAALLRRTGYEIGIEAFEAVHA